MVGPKDLVERPTQAGGRREPVSKVWGPFLSSDDAVCRRAVTERSVSADHHRLFQIERAVVSDRGDWRRAESELRVVVQPGLRALQDELKYLEDFKIDTESFITVTIDEAAVAPNSPIKPKRVVILGMDFIGALLGAIFLALYMESIHAQRTARHG